MAPIFFFPIFREDLLMYTWLPGTWILSANTLYKDTGTNDYYNTYKVKSEGFQYLKNIVKQNYIILSNVIN